MPQKYLAPGTGWVLCSLNDPHREDVTLWLLTSMLDVYGFLSVAETAMQCHKDDKVTIVIPDGKTTIEIGRPPTLDLNATGAVCLGMGRNEVITREIRIGFERLNPCNQEMSKDEELCPSRFEGGIQSWHNPPVELLSGLPPGQHFEIMRCHSTGCLHKPRPGFFLIPVVKRL
jgi:hypothetical protein